MRKKLLTSLIFFLILAPFFALNVAEAATVSVKNYFYAHANKPGNYYLKQKDGSDSQDGDEVESDAYIRSFFISAQGLGSGDKLKVVLPDGTAQYVQPGNVTLEKQDAKWMKIVLIKTSNTETFVRVKSLSTFDYGANVNVLYTLDLDPPTKYGDLGGDSGSGGNDGGGSSGGVDWIWNNGTRRITWTKWPTGTYQIVVTGPDGQKYKIVPNDKVFAVETNAGGKYKLQAVKMDGTVLYEKTMTVPAADDPGGGTDPGGEDPGGGTDPGGEDPGGGDPGGDPGGGGDTGQCNACENIKKTLECPEFDTYLGKWADMIRSTFPPPPDWEEIADLIGDATINHLSDYLGDVPSPPSRSEIERATDTPLPQLDTSVETDDLVPKVPDEYKKGKIVFELNNGPEIEVKDESKPFRIDDPLENVNQKSDPVGVPVIPGDPRNNSDGIKQPDSIDTGAAPQPKVETGAPPVPNPTPETPPSTVPVPADPGGGPAIPDATDGPIPIPKGGG
ncbi:hypothetical protein [Paenibacillus oralis]|nr:hypothetical protein [Paenibacillus oralis]